MDLTVVGYLAYLVISIVLTVWVARVLSRNGIVFLRDALGGDATLATAVNQLLQVGFYLLNLGFIAWWLKTDSTVLTIREVYEFVAVKIGVIMVVLGILHVFNVMVLSRIRHRGLTTAAALSRMEPPTPRSEAAPARLRLHRGTVG